MNCLLFDLRYSQPIGKIKFHGGGEYMKTVFRELVMNYSQEIEIITMFDFSKFMDDWVLDLIKKNNIKAYDVKNLNDYLALYSKEKINCFFNGVDGGGLYETVTLPYPVRKVTTIHGLRRIELISDKYERYFCHGKEKIKAIINSLFPKKIKKRRIGICREIFQYYDTYFCDSLHTKYAIQNFFPDLQSKGIKVLYVPSKYTEEDFSSKETTDGNYILMVSGNRFEKNVIRGLKAFDELISSKSIDCDMVITGKIPPKLTEKIKNMDRVRNLDYVSPNELEDLYKNCRLFLYPTLNEGFGLPPLEAMRYGKTCVLSNINSLPELYAGYSYMFSPNEVEDIKNRILMGYNNPIDSKKVTNRFKEINDRQISDLKELCTSIVEETNRAI